MATSAQRFERRDSGIERRTATSALKIKAVSEDGVIEGYGAVFGLADTYNDVIAPGAFSGSLSQHKSDGTMPAMLWQHETDEPIGVWTSMVEDAKGLKITGKLCMDSAQGKEAYALLKMGALNGLSIGFIAKEWNYDVESDVRTLTGIDLWEVSLVTFPSQAKAQVSSVKAAGDMPAPKDAERILRDAGFSKADATAFVSRVMRMGEERREAAQSIARAQQAAERLLSALKGN